MINILTCTAFLDHFRFPFSSLSTIIFTALRGFAYLHEYYDARLKDIQEMTRLENMATLSKSEKEFLGDIYLEYKKGYLEEHGDPKQWGKTKWVTDLIEAGKSRDIKIFGGTGLHIWKARINIWLGFAAFCYLLGLAL